MTIIVTYRQTKTCPRCKGTGRKYCAKSRVKCPVCKGAKVVPAACTCHDRGWPEEDCCAHADEAGRG